MPKHLYLSAAAVARWVKERWGGEYSVSGMTALLHRLGYVYKKPKLLPGKPDAERQRAFLAEQQAARASEGPRPIDYVDAVHPQHNPVLAHVVIEREGSDHGFAPARRISHRDHSPVEADDHRPDGRPKAPECFAFLRHSVMCHT